MRCAIAVAALLAAGCGPSADDSTSTTSSTGDGSSTTEGEATSSSSTDATSTSSGSTEATSSSSTSSTSEATTDPVTSTGPAPFCGDGVKDPGEECDNGGFNGTDCDDDCTLPVCGDGHLNGGAGEQCDDGNDDDHDKCFACGPALCGDGVVNVPLEGPEECDDGNLEDDDGCSSTCKSEIVFDCGEGFTTDWCLMDGPVKPQYTTCSGISNLARTCHLPRIKYGEGVATGYPIKVLDDTYMKSALTSWCLSLGFTGFTSVEYGDRMCSGPVVWTNGGYDDVQAHWADAADGFWFPPEVLALGPCPDGEAILSVTCARD